MGTRGDPEKIRQGVEGQAGTPLYVQWQRLEVVTKAARNFLNLRDKDNMVVVAGSKRDHMERLLKQARSRQRYFEGIVNRTLETSHLQTVDLVSALIEVDRRRSRTGSSSKQGAPQEPLPVTMAEQDHDEEDFVVPLEAIAAIRVDDAEEDPPVS